MKSEKLVILCSRCNGDIVYVLASGPIRVECPTCMAKVDAAERTLGLLKELMEKVK